MSEEKILPYTISHGTNWLVIERAGDADVLRFDDITSIHRVEETVTIKLNSIEDGCDYEFDDDDEAGITGVDVATQFFLELAQILRGPALDPSYNSGV